jgi:hypothetical protein
VRANPLLAALALVAAGCGNAASERTPLDAIGVKTHRSCTHASRGFRACTRFDHRGETSGLYRFSGNWRPLRATAPAPAGWWRRVVTSPDRSTLLLQWSGECEVQSTYLLSSRGGSPRALFRGHESTAIGWTHGGDAVVRLTEAVWRGNAEVHAPGVYRVDRRTLAVHRVRSKPGHGGC